MTTLDQSSVPVSSPPSGGAPSARSLGWRGVAAVSIGSVLLGGAGAALRGVLSSGGSTGFGGPGGPGGFGGRGGFGGTPPGQMQQFQPGQAPQQGSTSQGSTSQGSTSQGSTSGTTTPSSAPLGGPRRALHGVVVVGLAPRESVRGAAASTPAASV